MAERVLPVRYDTMRGRLSAGEGKPPAGFTPCANPALPDQPRVGRRRRGRRPLEGLPVDTVETETPPVAVQPLVAVRKAPVEVAADVETFPPASVQRLHVPADERRLALGVLRRD